MYATKMYNCARLISRNVNQSSTAQHVRCGHLNSKHGKWSKKSSITENSALLSQQSKPCGTNANFRDGFLNPVYHELPQFKNAIPAFIAELSDADVFKNTSPEVLRQFTENLEYNMTTGKRLRPMLLIHTYRELTSNYREMDENIGQIYVLAWCAELLNTWSIILDDIVDDSEFRRERLSWYYKKNKHLTAAFDADFLRESAYIVLDKYFAENEHYEAIFKIFNESVLRLAVGEYIDTAFTENKNNLPIGKGRLDSYNFDVYEHIVHNKSSHLSVYVPLAVATIMAGKMNPINEEVLWDLSKQACFLIQAKNDFSDIFADRSHNGKESTDIQNGKCAWPILKALELCSQEQKEILELNYGLPEPEKVQAVRRVFDALDLVPKWHEYEANYRRNLSNEIAQKLDPTLQMVFNHFVELFVRME